VIDDPIANLSIISDCEGEFKRDYVLLLDPAFVADNAISNGNNVNNTTNSFDNSSVNANVMLNGLNNDSVIASANNKKSKNNRVRANQKITKKTSNTQSKNFEKSPVNSVPVEHLSPKESPTLAKPHLSISGGGALAALANSIGLRLDKNIVISPERLSQTPVVDTDMQDEVTVMNNRLEHLEKQVTGLQQRNKVLTADNKAKTEQIAKQESTRSIWSWLPYLLGASALVGGYFVADKWRRRRQEAELESLELATKTAKKVAPASKISADLFDNESPNDVNETKTSTLAEIEEDAPQELNDTDFESTQAIVAQVLIEDNNAENYILDHADVFLSHGRRSLAIQLLQNHLSDFPKQSVTIWLFLLDLIAKEKLQSLYEQTTLQCKEHFNIKIPEFSATADSGFVDNGENKSIESFPRLMAGLQHEWGQPTITKFLDDLIYNSRLEVRVGFEKSVIDELLLLKNIALEEEKQSAEVINLGEFKQEAQERKEAEKAAKLGKMEELEFEYVDKTGVLPEVEFERAEEPFEFNLEDFKQAN
jgi:TolA-binding protein